MRARLTVVALGFLISAAARVPVDFVVAAAGSSAEAEPLSI